MIPAFLGSRRAAGQEGISAEVLDLRTLVPLDEPAVIASVEKTGRAVIGARGGPGLRVRGRDRGPPRREGVLLPQSPDRPGHGVRHAVPVLRSSTSTYRMPAYRFGGPSGRPGLVGGAVSFEFRLPDIGEGVAEGEVVQWFVKEGDTIREDAPLVSVLTDKANVEIPSPKAGRVTKIHASVGEKVKVGGLLVTIEAGGEGPPPPGPTAAGTNPPDARAQAAPAAPAHAAASPPVARATPVASTSPPDPGSRPEAIWLLRT